MAALYRSGFLVEMKLMYKGVFRHGALRFGEGIVENGGKAS